ncbi:unnamed protein product [Rotaria magnacalcarata]
MAKATASTTDVNQAKSLAFSFINSNKGKPLLLADEYVFKLNKNTTTTKYWICALNGCSAKVHTDLNSQFIKIFGDHNHFPEKEQLEVRKFQEKVKQRAIHETTPIPRIYDLPTTFHINIISIFFLSTFFPFDIFPFDIFSSNHIETVRS